jgi:hypothetical protein
MERGRTPRARQQRDGSNALSNGSSKKSMTRVGSVRLERRKATAKLKEVVKEVIRRRYVWGTEDIVLTPQDGVELFAFKGLDSSGIISSRGA